ncbi:DNA primase family protein [Rhodomicrobium lacus]|uniref:DNA primase family protein n=1 Tax=Rhodomicrobium lacus TaxID=2498452 RepID=UPI000F8D1FE5|nr:phage/plasmid primase, P4 family [Rhodomicrobium lacus]
MTDDLFPKENQVLAALDAAEAPGAVDDAELAKLELNDLGNARRMLARFGSDIAYTDERGWLAWDGTRWSDRDGAAVARRYAHKTSDALWDEVQHVVGDRKKSFRKHAVRSGNSGGIASMLTEAAAYSRKVSDDFDAHPYLLNVQNGTLFLRAEGEDDVVQLRKHNRFDLITRCCTVRYNPDAPTPKRWLKFLEECQPEEDMRRFIQQWLGYCLSGSILEQCVAIFEGQGSNGKSTIIDVVSTILGDYAATTPIETWLYTDRKSGSGPSPDLAELPGVRLVRTSEPEAGVRLSESVIKQWTGGERMKARHLNKPFFEFKPVGKLTMSLNVKPSIVGKDFGIRRRIHVVPFRRTFTRTPGRDFTAELLEEREGILNWLLDGWRDYHVEGLRVPAAVLAATDAYFAENDPIGQFVLTACETRPAAAATDEFKSSASELYAGYRKWCEMNNEEPKKQTPFGRRLNDLGYPKVMGTGGYVKRIGIKLKIEYWPSGADA